MNTVAAAAKVGSDQVTRVLSIPVCRGVVNKFDGALDVADRYVDDYLPSGRHNFISSMSFCIQLEDPETEKNELLSMCVFGIPGRW